MKARVSFSQNVFEKDLHKAAKIWCIEAQWCCSFQLEDESMLVLSGAFAPQLRATTNKTAENIAAALMASHAPPEALPFSLRLRVIDTDSAPNNRRAERLLQEEPWQQWASLHVDCLCHKVHGAVAKTMDLHNQVRTGIKNIALHLSDRLPQLRQSLKNVVSDSLVVVEGAPNLPAVALDYRAEVLRVFTPPNSRARGLLATIAVCLLNGDWGAGLVHYCHSGCCTGRAQAVSKVQHALSRLLSLIKPVVLTGNWAHWRRSFYFVGVFGQLHKLLFAVAHEMQIVRHEGNLVKVARVLVFLEMWAWQRTGVGLKRVLAKAKKPLLLENSALFSP